VIAPQLFATVVLSFRTSRNEALALQELGAVTINRLGASPRHRVTG
ncbi:uncharacterized protein METZ01_LOCUS52436, partial [marine metagenome]